MALRVEVAGFGLCQTAAPYSVFVVCVQQENFEAWTVYRTYISFHRLRNELLTHYPQLPAIANFDQENMQLDSLESCRVVLDRWLQVIASNSYVLRMQSMYQFLCIDANQPPPYLEIHWRESVNGSFEEMDMEEMFDGDQEEDEDEDDEDEESDDSDEGEGEGDFEVDIDDVPEQQKQQSVFGFDNTAGRKTIAPHSNFKCHSRK